jgi:DNA-binding transcriptional MerR regulator
MTNKIYAIGELAKELEITSRSIRFYEESGLLSPRRNGQNRVYGKKDKVRLNLILRGKRLGFTLAQTKTLFELYDSHQNSEIQLEAMLNMTSEKRVHMLQQMEDIKALMNELDEVEARCKEELTVLQRGKIA